MFQMCVHKLAVFCGLALKNIYFYECDRYNFLRTMAVLASLPHGLGSAMRGGSIYLLLQSCNSVCTFMFNFEQRIFIILSFYKTSFP